MRSAAAPRSRYWTTAARSPGPTHSVWAVPLLILQAAAAVRRRSGWYALATAVTSAVFSGLIQMPWPGHPLNPGQLLESDLYVLVARSV